ncbi:DUF885 family protein [Caulobacter sp. 17J65-9]|uniref:DUF885 domain-containing protein n=1 Tax=Caulobacter sp. 17J65-9 TaxID=2709382 RepID=UPI0013C54487|nr:DUF885 family protein [Caulobacter sp. 17J65-9]NEX92669.1 DUF885 family protein [Caulobacter sp. 17J65-9]
MLDRRRLLLSAAAIGATSFAAGGALARAAAPTGSDPATAAKLNAFFDKVFKDSLKYSPEGMTSLGLDRAPDGAWAKSKLDDRSTKEIERQIAQNRGYAAEMKAIDRKKLAGMDAVNYDTVDFAGSVGLHGMESFTYGARTYPQAYVVNQLSSAYLTIPDFLDSQHQISDKSDADAYLSRLAAFATALDQETDRARADAAKGAAPPDFIIDKTLLQLRGMRATPAADTTMVKSVARRAKEAGVAGDYGADAQKIVETQVYPALDRQIAAMEAMRPTATHDAGVWRLPDGDAYYDWGLESYTTTKMTGAEIHKMGLEQVAEISGRIDALMKAQGMTQGTVGQRLSAMSKDPRFLYPNTDAGKAELIADLNRHIQVVSAKLPAWFGALPKAGVEVRRVPVAIEAGAPGGYYQGPTLDGSRPGAYYINLRDTAEWPKWSLPTLTHHEAIPGHHLQITLALEAQGIPMLRKVMGFSAYSEGWALYAEQLAEEMGMYDNDPYGRIGFLQSYLFRAVRLVVDSGLHYKRWSREQAIKYMTEHLGEPESAHVTEVERYCVWPGQASSYKVGQTKWMQLRENAKKTLGPKFDIKSFHDAGLLSGGMPMAVLERVIQDWTASKA